MTNSPNPNQDQQNQQKLHRARSRRLWRRVGLSIGILTLAGVCTGAWWAWRFVSFELVPLVERNLTDLLNRPVDLGELEDISFTEIIIGPSRIPITTTDPDRVDIERVRVNFNPVSVLTERRLGLDVVLENADVYLQQNAEGQWVSTQLAENDGNGGPIQVQLDRIRLLNSQISLAPSLEIMAEAGKPGTSSYADVQASAGVQPLIQFGDVQGSLRLQDDNQIIRYDVDAKPVSGGRLRIGGETRREVVEPREGEEVPVGIQRTRISIQSDQVSAADVSALVAVPVTLNAGQLFGNLTLEIEGDALRSLDGTLRFQDLAGQVQNLPQSIRNGAGRLRFQERTITLENVEATYGQIPALANGTIHLDNGYDLAGRLRGVNIAAIQTTAGFTLPFETAGAFDANVTITGELNNPRIRGTIDNTTPLRIDRVDVASLRTQFDLLGDRLFLDEVVVRPAGGGVVQAQGEIGLGENGEIGLTGTIRDVSADRIAQGYGVNLNNVRLGTLTADLNLAGPRDQIQTLAQWQLPEATYPGQGEIAFIGDEILFRDTAFQVGDGRVTAEGAIQDGQWRAIAQASNIDLEPFAPQLGGQVQTASANLTGQLRDFSISTIQGIANATLSLAGGTVTANGTAQRGLWQASVLADNVLLQQFSPELQGFVSGDVRLNGSLANLSPRAIRAEGDVAFSRGISFFDRPLTASLRWLGDRLQIDQAQAPGFAASGYVLAQLDGSNGPRIPGFDLDVDVQDFDLRTLDNLPINLPDNVQVAGIAGFDGNISGTPSTPNVSGRLRLDNFVANGLRFEPVLTGNVQFVGNQGLDVELTGRNDRIAARLDGAYRPEYFLVRQGNAFAQGTTVGDRLDAQVANFPLGFFNVAPAANLGLGAVTGNATGNLNINLSTYAAAGDLTIVQPGLGYITAQQFQGQFRYADGSATLTNAVLSFDNSRYLISASVNNLGQNPAFQGQLIAERGDVRDLLTAFQWFELSDVNRGIRTPVYESSSTVQTVPVGDSNAALINQLRRYSEIIALLEIQAEQESQRIALPALYELQGGFTGNITFSGTQQDGVSAEFSLRGNDWTWGDYEIAQVLVDGSLNDGELSLLPLQLRSDESYLTFSGRVGGEAQSGQLEVSKVPVEAIRDFLRLPLDVTGELSANAVLEGSLANPQARGELAIANATINQEPVQGGTTRFSYEDARLRFLSQFQLSDEDPLRLAGSIPYSLPFMDVEPASDEITLNARVRDEGLAFINLFTDQVAWEGGEGTVDVAVSGTLRQPQIEGSATFNGASFSASALPEPLTNVNGRVLFNRSFVDVEQLTGQFRQGQVQAQGLLPVFDENDFPQGYRVGTGDSPLTVNLDQLVLNFKGLYQGAVDGDLIVSGTALAPRITGEIALSRGRVELPSSGGQAAPSPEPEFDPNSITSPPRFDNLLITLGDRVRVTLDPILNFVARGELLIDGTLGDLRPSGDIRLLAGQVNLFTTQFNLVRSSNNVAEFSPNRGLDPFLNVELQASVTEVNRASATPSSPFAVAEISDTPITDFGRVGTVRVQASVVGYASQLFDNLELTSSPSRTENEIILLIGGGFVDTLGQGNGTLAIANLAGSALLTRVQNVVSNAIGLTDFRLFPTITSNGASNSSLDLASEVGIDITGNLSASALVILTDDAPAQFNLRYRLNDEFLLRGYLDTSGGTGGILEFERRF